MNNVGICHDDRTTHLWNKMQVAFGMAATGAKGGDLDSLTPKGAEFFALQGKAYLKEISNVGKE